VCMRVIMSGSACQKLLRIEWRLAHIEWGFLVTTGWWPGGWCARIARTRL
jgi:hypothetical protein